MINAQSACKILSQGHFVWKTKGNDSNKWQSTSSHWQCYAPQRFVYRHFEPIRGLRLPVESSTFICQGKEVPPFWSKLQHRLTSSLKSDDKFCVHFSFFSVRYFCFRLLSFLNPLNCHRWPALSFAYFFVQPPFCIQAFREVVLMK